MLYVKIMSGEDMQDTNPYKNYLIVPVENNEVMQFIANQDKTLLPDGYDGPSVSNFVLEVHASDGGIERHQLFGNAYVMTESGKTIASHGC